MRTIHLSLMGRPIVRFSEEKEELLSQVLSLESANEGRAIVSAVQFTLCVVYSRRICMKVVDLIGQCVNRSHEDVSAVQALIHPLLMTTASDSLLRALEINFTRSMSVLSSCKSMWPIDMRLPAFEPLSARLSAQCHCT